MDNIILFDMDNTLCDWDGAMIKDLRRVLPPEFTDKLYIDYWMGNGRDNRPDWVEELMTVIRTQVGWWRNLRPLRSGMQVLDLVLGSDWEPNILTKGPATKPYAWAEKVEWCAKHIRQRIPVTVCADKSLVYGRALVDDYPPYVEKWLKYRPNGLVLMPAHDYNRNFVHPSVLRITDNGEDLALARKALDIALARKEGDPLILRGVL